MKKQCIYKLLAILCLFFVVELAMARGGGGGGHGSSSSSSSSSGGYSSRSHNSSGDSRIFFYVVLPIVLILLLRVFLYVYMLNKKAKAARNVMQLIAKNDPFWQISDMTQHARETFMIIQDAWQKRDISIAKDFVTPELHKKYDKMLWQMTLNHEINIIKDIKISEVRIISCDDRLNNAADRYVAYICGDILDYTISDLTQKVVKNPKMEKESFSDTYHFVRIDKKWSLEKINNKVRFRNLLFMKNRIEKSKVM